MLLSVGNEYDVGAKCILWEEEAPASDEVCVLDKGCTVELMQRRPARLQVQYGRYVGWIDATVQLKEKKKGGGFFASMKSAAAGIAAAATGDGSNKNNAAAFGDAADKQNGAGGK